MQSELEVKEALKQERREQDYERFLENEINWVSGENWTWDYCKGYSKKLWGHKNEYLEEEPKWFFLAHTNDVIRGKPQLIEQVQKRIPLVRLAIKKQKDKHRIADDGETIGCDIDVQSFYFFDEKFDKRHDGFQKDVFALDFWHYKIITDDGKEVFIWTQKKLPNGTCSFNGMLVYLDDYAELSRSLKVKSISKVFFMKDYEPDAKKLSKEDLVRFTKSKKVGLTEWNFLLSYHPTGNVNLFDDDIMNLRSAQVLSGKFDGSPLHTGFIGNAGTKKSWGHLGTLDFKFSESSNIIGGGNTRAKALVPSFKEKPADIGYFARTERMGFIDEVFKMAEFELNKHQSSIQNLFGEWNDLLDNIKRTVGSGNNNTCEVEASCKNVFVGNPLGNRAKIGDHVGILDKSMMSRILWFVQDEDEQNFLRSSSSVLRISPNTMLRPLEIPQNSPHTFTRVNDIFRLIENRKKDIVLGKCWGCVKRSDFLTIFDSSNDFVCNIDFDEVERIVKNTSILASEPMKSSVWLPRAEHHTYLLIDGLCKQRCLFRDYDETFTPLQEDYDLAERILVRMVRSWDTDLSPKEDFS